MDEVPAKLQAIEARYKDAAIQRIDGVSVDYPDWHFNVRASNTEPLLRLNLEAATPELMEKRRDEVLESLRGDGWSGRRGSNPRPTAWKAVTLPLSYSRISGCFMVERGGFEPP